MHISFPLLNVNRMLEYLIHKYFLHNKLSRLPWGQAHLYFLLLNATGKKQFNKKIINPWHNKPESKRALMSQPLMVRALISQPWRWEPLCHSPDVTALTGEWNVQVNIGWSKVSLSVMLHQIIWTRLAGEKMFITCIIQINIHLNTITWRTYS